MASADRPLVSNSIALPCSARTVNLNRRANTVCRKLLDDTERLRVGVQRIGGAWIVDCGIDAPGGLEAGRVMAEVCLAGLGTVDLTPGFTTAYGLAISVSTEHPVAACMASQYAGWQITQGKYFAMGSGPMRAVAGREPLFDTIGFRETADNVIGVLEARKFPTPEVVAYIAEACHVAPERLILLIAPTASQAGTVQIVARTVETALHKLHELGFDISRVVTGHGVAPLPPVAADDLAAIGRTNDAVLYGGKVTLWVRGDDASLEDIGPRVPSNSSPDHGRPFRAIFESYNCDFYKVDPRLFSPAMITFINLDTGRSHRFGQLSPDVLAESFSS